MKCLVVWMYFEEIVVMNVIVGAVSEWLKDF